MINPKHFRPENFSPDKLERIAQQIHEAMPASVKALGGDIDQKMKQVIQGQLAKLEVVSREEFDVQTQVLLRTKKQLSDLESRLALLESNLTTVPDAYQSS